MIWNLKSGYKMQIKDGLKAIPHSHSLPTKTPNEHVIARCFYDLGQAIRQRNDNGFVNLEWIPTIEMSPELWDELRSDLIQKGYRVVGPTQDNKITIWF
jgi:hypothetical protein